MQGAQKQASHGEDLTRESPLLHCLGEVRSETRSDWGTERGMGKCF